METRARPWLRRLLLWAVLSLVVSRGLAAAPKAILPSGGRGLPLPAGAAAAGLSLSLSPPALSGNLKADLLSRPQAAAPALRPELSAAQALAVPVSGIAAPALPQPAAARSGESLGALQALHEVLPQGRDARDDQGRLEALYSGGDKKRESSQVGEAPYDIIAHPLHPDEEVHMILDGYRLDRKAGRILVPGRDVPMTSSELKDYRHDLSFSRHLGNMSWLYHERDELGAAADNVARVLASQKDVIPRRIRLAWKRGAEAFRKEVSRRLESLYRRRFLRPDDARFEEVMRPKTGEPYFDDAERALGERLQKEIVSRLSQNPEGAKLLEELRGPDGTIRMPAVLVLQVDGRYGAFYNPNRDQMAINADPAALAGADLAAYVAENETVIFHELVHYAQDLKNGFFDAAMAGELSDGVMLLENEFEAFGRTNLYVQAALRADPSKTYDSDAVRYVNWLNDFDAWRDEIARAYTQNWPSMAADLARTRRLHEEVARLSQKVMRANPERAELMRRKHRRGAAVLAQEAEAAEAMMAGLRESRQQTLQEGLSLWARSNLEQGHWPQVFYAYGHMRKAASGERREELDRRYQEAATQAMLWLHRGDQEMDLNARVQLVNTITNAYNEANRPFHKELWVLRRRIFQEAAGYYRSLARREPSGAARDQHLKTAGQFSETLEQDLSILRRYAEINIESLSRETDPGRRATLLDWGLMQAELVGDPELVAQVNAAGSPSLWKRLKGKL